MQTVYHLSQRHVQTYTQTASGSFRKRSNSNSNSNTNHRIYDLRMFCVCAKLPVPCASNAGGYARHFVHGQLRPTTSVNRRPPSTENPCTIAKKTRQRQMQRCCAHALAWDRLHHSAAGECYGNIRMMVCCFGCDPDHVFVLCVRVRTQTYYCYRMDQSSPSSTMSLLSGFVYRMRKKTSTPFFTGHTHTLRRQEYTRAPQVDENNSIFAHCAPHTNVHKHCDIFFC